MPELIGGGAHICSTRAKRPAEFKPIVADARHHEFWPRSTPRFIVIYQTDGGFAVIIPVHVCFVTVPFSTKGGVLDKMNYLQ